MVAKKSDLLVPLKEYLSAGIQVGTKSKTRDMEDFIYKVHQNKLTILNVEKINERLKIAAQLISQYSPEEILVVCRRENGWFAGFIYWCHNSFDRLVCTITAGY